ncbi:glycoside hydrolase family 53 protein [Marinactinospora rubrisoli]|uniref:Arabinogalactan endo-beta-1,4-galactanase n=1 Tax=Marinactinospora rubrisoli TaxID=2715399 RepID=A0ABW2KH10_9ACTN
MPMSPRATGTSRTRRAPACALAAAALLLPLLTAPAPAAAAVLDVRGADVSSLAKNEDFGAGYLTSSGEPADPLRLLAESGVTHVRLKVWVDPADGYNDHDRVLEMARRAHDAGLRTLIDFHYSDFWADPGRQTKPAAWAGLSGEELRTAVYDHTYALCAALAGQGTPADMVQVGNELNAGMLWPDGSIDDWEELARLLTAGASAVRDADPATRVVLHLAEGGDNEQTRWWFDQAVARDVPFDVIGLSYYGYWHGGIEDLRANLADAAARYGKDVLVAETAYPFTLDNDDAHPNIIAGTSDLVPGYPATPEGQSANLRDVMAAVESVPGGRGLGVFYWEPTWTAVAGSGWDPTDPASGNAWENQALFDYADRALPALEVLGGD